MPYSSHIDADEFGVPYQGFGLFDLFPGLPQANAFQVGFIQLLELFFTNKVGLMPQVGEAELFESGTVYHLVQVVSGIQLILVQGEIEHGVNGKQLV